MIKSFIHKGLELYFTTGSKAGIQPHHSAKLHLQLSILDKAKQPSDMNAPGWKLHQLSNGLWSISVNGNWRVTFVFEGTDAVLVDYLDYH